MRSSQLTTNENAELCKGPLCFLQTKVRGLCNSHYKQLMKGNELKPLKMRKHFPHEYSSWSAMRARCYKVNGKDFKNYGAKGVKVCSRWDIFEYFLFDMGPRPFLNSSIERKENSKDYCLENCEWIGQEKQSFNRQNNVMTFEKAREMRKVAKGKTYRELGEIFNCSLPTAYRVVQGISWKE